MKNNRLIFALLSATAIVYLCVLLLFVFRSGTDVPASGKYLLMSAYVEDETDARNYAHQAVILYDLEKRRIADTVSVRDGSALMGSGDRTYLVSGPGYGLLQTANFSNEMTEACDIVTGISVGNGKLAVGAPAKTCYDNGCILLKRSEDCRYYLQRYDDFAFKVLRVSAQADEIDLGYIFDDLGGWAWPCDNICVSDSEKVAILDYNSWFGDNSLRLLDFSDLSCVTALEGEYRGPLCWIGESDLLLWEKNEKGSYTACVFGTNKGAITEQLPFDAPYPKAAVAYLNGACAYWSCVDAKNPFDAIELMLYDGEEVSCLLHLSNVTGTNDYSAEWQGVTIHVPLEYYQPSLVLLDTQTAE